MYAFLALDVDHVGVPIIDARLDIDEFRLAANDIEHSRSAAEVHSVATVRSTPYVSASSPTKSATGTSSLAALARITIAAAARA